MFIRRVLRDKLLDISRQFATVALLGPRQSGKTTLCKEIFQNHQYVNLEEPDIREFAKEDPIGFLDQSEAKSAHGIILDEIQNAPDLLSYIQVRIDQGAKEGFYILTGSHNILLNEQISQTLAGRISIQTLFPLSIDELSSANQLPENYLNLLFNGFYPTIYKKKINPSDWYKSYIQTYVERDVRSIRNISDLGLFQKFIKLCAGRIGQLLDLTSLSNDCGVSVNTARQWISILEASYIIFLLTPHHQNFSKRLIKSPKIYFIDPGLACSLLGIDSSQMLEQHYLRGGLFESMILSNLFKQRLNQGKTPNIHFWRDKSGLEIDCIVEEAGKLTPIEIKSAKTLHADFFTSLTKFCKLASLDPSQGIVIYGGDEPQKRQSGRAISWKKSDLLRKNQI